MRTRLDRLDRRREIRDLLPVVLAASTLDVDGDLAQAIAVPENALLNEQVHVQVAQHDKLTGGLLESEIGDVNVAQVGASHGEVKTDGALRMCQ